MKIAALCFDGDEDEELIDAALELLPAFERVEAWCAYGDYADQVLQEMEARHHAPHHPPREIADSEQAFAIAKHAVALLAKAGIDATPRGMSGRDPEHVLAEESGPERMLIMFAGHRRGVGPKSIGHVARFVLDHAKGPVLLLRSET